MDAVGGNHAKHRIRSTKDACFLSYLEDRAKDKHIYKNKHDHIQTQM
jgi:hypothetical protein